MSVSDSKKTSRKGTTSSRKMPSLIEEPTPALSDEIKMVIENQIETLPEQILLPNINSGKSSRVSRQSNKENNNQPEDQVQLIASAATIKKTVRKTELPSIPEVVPKPEPLTEEEIREKYAENEHYQEWNPKHQYYKKQLEVAFKKGLPKLYPNDEEMEAIQTDHARLSQIRDKIRDKLHDFKFSTTEPSGEDPASFDLDTFLEDLEV